MKIIQTSRKNHSKNTEINDSFVKKKKGTYEN